MTEKSLYYLDKPPRGNIIAFRESINRPELEGLNPGR